MKLKRLLMFIFLSNSFNSLHGEDKRTALLSYKIIDKNNFFNIPKEYTDIDKINEELDNTNEINWPCSRDEEVFIFTILLLK